MIAAALLAVAALARAAPGAAPTVELSPPSLTLGSGERARVRVRGPALPRVVVSAGALGALREAQPGTWEAELEPPLEAHPQLALVAAIAPEGVAFGCLPLVGRGVAVAQTEPNATISVWIRDRPFGPATADGRGVAQVPVEVPPGERFARHRGRELDLRVPPLRQLLVVLGADAARADREEVVTVHAFAATPAGAPWAGAPLVLAASAGRLGEAREVAPGAFVAEWTLPPGDAGPVTVEARLPEAPAAVVELARFPGPPARVAVRLGAERMIAGDPPLEVLVEISDAAGNRVDGEASLRTSFGELSAPVREGVGVVRAALAVPERLDGRGEALVTASLGAAADRRAVALAPAAPAAVALELERAELVTDGVAGADVLVAVTDRFGNGVDEPVPALESGRGRLAPPSRDGPGRWRTRYAPARARRGGEDLLVARAGAIAARAPVRLLPPPRRLAATARLGALHAFGGFTAPYAALALEAWPVRFGGAWGAALGLAHVRTARDERLDVGGSPHALEGASSLAPLEVSALARRRLRPRLAATGAAGLGLVRIHSTVALDGERTSEEWGWAAALHGSAGLALELPAWHSRLSAELRLGWQEDPGMSSFRGALGSVAFALGWSHDAL